MILSGHYQMSLAPLERLGPYGGTYDIVRTLSNDLWSVNIICPGHYQMSLGNAKCPMVIINCTHF